MRFRWTDVARRSNAGLAIFLGLAISGCAFTPYEARHEMMSDSRSQIWLSEARQVKTRAAQSRVFEDADRVKDPRGNRHRDAGPRVPDRHPRRGTGNRLGQEVRRTRDRSPSDSTPTTSSTTTRAC